MTVFHETVHPEDGRWPAASFEQRAQEIGEMIDPEHTLPQITLERDYSNLATGGAKVRSMPYLVYHAGNNIGTAWLITRVERRGGVGSGSDDQ